MKPRIAKTIAVAALLCSLVTSAYAAVPQGWYKYGSMPNDFDMGSVAGNRHAGGKNGFIRAKHDSSGFGTLMQTINAQAYHGKRVRLSGWLKTTNAEKAALWMRVDGDGKKIVGFDNMDNRPVIGTVDWKRYDVVLDVPSDAVDIAFGFMLNGKGEVLVDDLKFEEVAKDVPVTAMGDNLPEAPVNLDFSK
jgi:hypothetical protein